MIKSEQLNELAAALAKAQAKIEGAVKDKANPAFRSKYADLGACWDAIREPLSSNGLSVAQFPRTVDGAVEVETMLLHASGQYIADVFTIPVTKRDAHGYMSAATYARRGGLMAAVGIAPVDDDANGAVSLPANAASPPPPSRPAPAPARTTPGGIDAETRQNAADAFVTQSIEAISKLKHQQALAEWWRGNNKAVQKLEANHPALYERLLVAYDEMRDRLPHVTQAA